MQSILGTGITPFPPIMMNGWVVQDEMRIQNTQCDNCLIGRTMLPRSLINDHVENFGAPEHCPEHTRPRGHKPDVQCALTPQTCTAVLANSLCLICMVLSRRLYDSDAVCGLPLQHRSLPVRQ